MKAVYEVCRKAKISLPKEVEDYFGGESPDALGVVVELHRGKDVCFVREYRADMQNGFEVYLDHLPKDIRILRFYNSY